ncbi:hypothetical protein SCLCIDRAFT_124853, partial [Scleroderma citrinum Foug A]
LCKLSFKMIHLTTLILPVWREILKDLRMKVSCMPRDVMTQWNSLFDLLEYALKHWKAIDLVMQRRELGMRDLELSNNEWELVEQLHSILKILKDAMLFFSRSTPTLAAVIPAMDHIDMEFATSACNKKLLLSIRSSVSLAKMTLNRYYPHTDKSEVYHIAMGNY